MICRKCAGKMKGVCVWDNPDEGHAYNLYQCQTCGAICKEDVWDDKGETWVLIDNIIMSLKKDEDNPFPDIELK